MSDDDELLERDAIQRQDEALEQGPVHYSYDPDDHRTLHIHLETDPDGYWGGVRRDWTIEIVPMRSFYKDPLASLVLRCQGETTQSVIKKITPFARGVLVGPKEIFITARSVDGERTLRFSQQRGFIP
jgi:hypothetical protein